MSSVCHDAGCTSATWRALFTTQLQTGQAFVRVFWQNKLLLSFYLLLSFMGAAPALTLQMTFKDVFHKEPDELQRYSTIIGLPWSIKVVYAFVSDRVPIFGYHRKPYVVIGTFSAAACWALAAWATSQRNVEMFVVWMFCASLCVAIADACVNAQLMTRIKRYQQSKELQTFAQISGSVGGLTGMIVGAYLVTHIEAAVSIFILTTIPLSMGLFALCTDEVHSAAHRPLDTDSESDTELDVESDADSSTDEHTVPSRHPRPQHKTIGEHLQSAWEFVSSRNVRYLLLFAVSLTITPDSGAAMLYFFTNELNVTWGFIAFMGIIGSISEIVGGFVYIVFLRNVSYRMLFVIVLVVMSAVRWSQLLLVSRANVWMGISDNAFLLGDDIVGSVTLKILIIPIMELISNLCPDDLEGTSYEIVMSTFNMCGILSSFLSAEITKAVGITSGDFGHLPLLVVITCSLNMLPFLFVQFIPSKRPVSSVQTMLERMYYGIHVLLVQYTQQFHTMFDAPIEADSLFIGPERTTEGAKAQLLDAVQTTDDFHAAEGLFFTSRFNSQL